MRVTTADFIDQYAVLAQRALAEPVTITQNGEDRLVVLSADGYARLKRRDRRVLRVAPSPCSPPAPPPRSVSPAIFTPGADPTWFSSARLRAGPMPSISSSSVTVVAFDRPAR